MQKPLVIVQMFFPIRDEGGGHDPVNKSLIAANVIIFIAVLPFHRDVVSALGSVPAMISSGQQLHTLFSSMFLHGGFTHLLGNMWYLWIFGDNVEHAMGHGRYLVFYLLTGLGGSLLHVVTAPGSTIPTIGASGAISGILGAYLALFPRNKVDAVMTMGVLAHVQISAKWVIGAWFLIQLFFSGFTLLGASTGVAYLAHLGGFLAGYLLARIFTE